MSNSHMVAEASTDDDDLSEGRRSRSSDALMGVRPLARLRRAALDMLLPPVCLGCRTRIMDHDALCPSCWRQINFIRPPLCDRLGIPLAFDAGLDPGAPTLSAAAIADPPYYDRARAVASFDGLMRGLIHGFKFHDSHNARRLFGRWLAEFGRDLLAETDLLVPVPLARWRLLARRFNQSQILAVEAGRRMGKPVNPFALQRIRSTAHQIGLTRAQRMRNVAGVFRVPQSELPAVAGKAIVLVDDVITSGATASAATRALKRAGARRVDVLALAIVSERYS
ncbi:ComF family protein [Hyphomicrobium sp.]|uniref:ComF family protein n=1 Tax=Hyphomicrobium sp. TaxID=82 RepID=UPI002D77055D|nr:ComF family protein [Hyphomicrobium sp.]HET6391093.1 ComF family protein [Hyphomicrobium sp.]